MSKKQSYLIAVGMSVLIIAIAVTVNLTSNHAKANFPSVTEGLPVPFNLVSQTPVSGGTQFIFRTVPLALMADDNPTIMNSNDHPGNLGLHGGITFIYVPLYYTISVYQNHLDPEQTAVLPTWWNEMLQLHTSHPDIHVVSQSVKAGRLVNGVYTPTEAFVSVPPPSTDYPCDPASCVAEPCVLEYTVVLSGNVSGITVPSSGNGIIYRVRMQP